MRVEEFSCSTLAATEAEIEKFVDTNLDVRENTYKQVKINISAAQEKQKAEFFRRKQKGVKSFMFSIGDIVYKRNNANLNRKGGKMDPKWHGPYKIIDINSNRRCKLLHCETKSVLKTRCAWDQLKPRVNSMLQHANDELKSMDLDQSDHKESNDLSDMDESYNVESINDVVNISQIDKNSNVSTYNLAASEQRFANLIDSSDWATSDEIDDFSELIKKLKNISGLQSTLVFSYLSSHHMIKSIPLNHPFLQILNKGGNHWIMISNIEVNLDVCTVYDSWFDLGYTAEQIEMLNTQIAQIFKTPKDYITVRFADVKQQTDSFNCGFYALAYSVSLVCNEDPRAEDYMSDQLRHHAYTCIRDEKIKSFPKGSAVRDHQGYLWEYQIDISCLCRMPHRKDMIICPTCYDHFHSECISFSSTGIKFLSMIFTFLILKLK